jgi:hypothetical protein
MNILMHIGFYSVWLMPTTDFVCLLALIVGNNPRQVAPGKFKGYDAIF